MSEPLPCNAKRRREEMVGDYNADSDVRDIVRLIGPHQLRLQADPSVPDVPLKICYGYAVPDTCIQDDLPLAQTYPHSRDKAIVFEEETHKYYLKGKQLPESVTKFIGDYAEHFDEDAVIEKMVTNKDFPMADKYEPYRDLQMWLPPISTTDPFFIQSCKEIQCLHDVVLESQQVFRECIIHHLTTWEKGSAQAPFDVMSNEIKECWELNREDASSRGTFLHLCMEYACNQELSQLWLLLLQDAKLHVKFSKYATAVYDDSGTLVRYENTSIEFKFGLDYLKVQVELGWRPFRTEHVIYYEFSNGKALPGSVDIQFQRDCDVHRQASAEHPKVIKLSDFKRTKVIQATNKFRNMNGCLRHLPSCELSKYSLQLCTYKKILQTYYDILVQEMTIVQFHPDYPSFNEYISLPLEKEVDQMFLEYQNKD